MLEDIAAWLARISWPLVSRVLGSWGIGTVTDTGASEALGGALGGAKTAFAGLGSEILQIITMSGFFDAMAITAGGIMSTLSWMVLKRFALQSGT